MFCTGSFENPERTEAYNQLILKAVTMDKAKNIRKFSRSAATKLVNTISDLEQLDISEARTKLACLEVQLNDKRVELQALDKEIINAMGDGTTDLSAEFEAADRYQGELVRGILRIKSILERNTEKPAIKIGENNTTVKTQACPVQLPKIVLQKFSGDPTKWAHFYQTFLSTIHNREGLNNIDRYNYLSSLLDGEASRAIQGFAATEQNYETVLDVLRERYGSEPKIVKTYIQRIADLKPVREASRLGALNNLLLDVLTCVRSLENLKVDTNTEFLLSRLKDLFPTEMLIDYERSKDPAGDNTKNLLAFIQREIQIRTNVSPPSTALDPRAPVFSPRPAITARLPTVWNNRSATPPFLPRAGLQRPAPWRAPQHQQPWRAPPNPPGRTHPVAGRPPNQWTSAPPQGAPRGTGRPQRPAAPGNVNENVCWRCFQPGHVRRNCPML